MDTEMDLDALRDFIAVDQAGSFAAAARATGTPKSTLSKRLQMLEASLGVRLVERSTRKLRLTPDGVLLRDRAVGLLAQADELERLMRGRNDEPQGRLRVSVPVLLGQTHMGRIAAAFSRCWPKVTIEAVFTDRYVDLIEEDFDCAIRTGPLDDSNLIARRLTSSHTILVAGARFLEALAPIESPADIVNVPTISFAPAGTPVPWQLESQGQRQNVNPRSAIVLGSLHATYMAAIAGGGVALIPEMVAKTAIAEGSLIALLPNWRGPATTISIVYPSRRHPSARLRAFIDVLTEQIAT
jgi:DNA-binding transcriptional LysR family regulator